MDLPVRLAKSSDTARSGSTYVPPNRGIPIRSSKAYRNAFFEIILPFHEHYFIDNVIGTHHHCEWICINEKFK